MQTPVTFRDLAVSAIRFELSRESAESHWDPPAPNPSTGHAPVSTGWPFDVRGPKTPPSEDAHSLVTPAGWQLPQLFPNTFPHAPDAPHTLDCSASLFTVSKIPQPLSWGGRFENGSLPLWISPLGCKFQHVSVFGLLGLGKKKPSWVTVLMLYPINWLCRGHTILYSPLDRIFLSQYFCSALLRYNWRIIL